MGMLVPSSSRVLQFTGLRPTQGLANAFAVSYPTARWRAFPSLVARQATCETEKERTDGGRRDEGSTTHPEVAAGVLPPRGGGARAAAHDPVPLRGLLDEEAPRCDLQRRPVRARPPLAVHRLHGGPAGDGA